MNPYRKAATFVIRMAALGLIIVPLIALGLDFFAAKTKHAPPTKLSVILKSASVFTGFVLFFGSSIIARKLTQDLDE